MKYTEKRFSVPIATKQWPACGEKRPDGAYCDRDWGHKGEHEGVTDSDEVVRWSK